MLSYEVTCSEVSGSTIGAMARDGGDGDATVSVLLVDIVVGEVERDEGEGGRHFLNDFNTA